MRAVGYVRVSRKNGRSGPSYLSPDIQREAIERLARAHGYELAEIVFEEDVSGKVPIEQRELGRLAQMVVDGEADALIVWKLSRFSRRLKDAVDTAERVTARGRLLAEDFDSRAPMAKAILGFLAGFAEEQLDQLTEGWRTARERAVERGVHTALPFGYRRIESGEQKGMLVPEPSEAAIVRQAYELRAAGVSFGAINRQLGLTNTKRMLASDVYLGVARSGKNYVNPEAHEPLVSQDLFDRANLGRKTQSPRTGERTRERLLIGLARCAGCGKTLKVTHRKGQADVYYCKDGAKVRCPARALAHCEPLDEYVAQWFDECLRKRPELVDAVAATQDRDDAVAELRDAEEEMEAYAIVTSARDPLFEAGRAVRQARIDAAREREAQATARTVRLPEGGSVLTLFHTLDAAGQAAVLGTWLDRVEVSRGANGHPAGHVRIYWGDGTLAHDDEVNAGMTTTQLGEQGA